MMLGYIERQIKLVKAYRAGIRSGLIAKTQTNSGQVVLMVKSGADQIYHEAAAEYRTWEIMGEYAVGSAQGLTLFFALIVLLEVFGVNTGIQ